jgi:ADP-heptose:LPS heptosyltransferase
MKLVDLSVRIGDFSDTAALASLLDLVITIDTSVAHLAGAMGLPVWVLTAHAPDWRYHIGREDNPWYPTMRLFRQERDGDWPAAIGRVAAALQRRAARP